MKLLIVLTVIILGAAGFIIFSKKDTAPRTTSLSFQTIQVDVQKGGQLIDVRTPEEFAQGHISESFNLPLQDIQQNKIQSVSKVAPVYVYCHSGNRSSQATAILKAAGFTNIIDLGAIAHVESIGGTIVK